MRESLNGLSKAVQPRSTCMSWHPLLTKESGTVALDKFDCEVLYALDHDARQSLVALANLLDTTRDRVGYRIERLKESGVISAFSAVLNPYKLGLVAYKTYLRLRNDRKLIARVVRFLRANPHVHWVAECEGTWDFIFVAFSETPKGFHMLQNALLSEFSEIILGFSVYTLVDVTYFRKRYFLGEGSANFSFGGWPAQTEIDSIDLGILECLAADCRSSVKQIAKTVGLSQARVSSRITRLEELGVILGYRIDIDHSKLGMTMFKVQVQLQKFSEAEELRLLEFCKKNPFIALFIQQIGDCKIELELETFGYDHLNQIRRELREAFPDLIRQMDATVIGAQQYRFAPFEMAKVGQAREGVIEATSHSGAKERRRRGGRPLNRP
jgi:Lrp/AsnC family leucine-responsive transcriptional regulator